MSAITYADFLARKTHLGSEGGFEPVFMPDFLFDFQRALVTWAVRKGRGAIFADCGLGKTPMLLTWAENVVRKTGGRVLILTPLAVGSQIAHEGERFGIEARRAGDGKRLTGISITNYERLHHFNPADFVGVACDESSAIKSFDGVRRQIVTEFMRKVPYRLLDTATAAPNDYIELGTSSEALGELGHMDMLARFFRNENKTCDTRGHWKGHAAPRAFNGQKWRFKGHAEGAFWKWVCSWARACRRPSDLGFSDERFVLPPLVENEHVVEARTLAEGMLFSMPANGMREEREERRRTIQERCERAADLVNGTGQPAVLWCHLNAEGDLLERLIPDAEQVSGSDTDDEKESKLESFARGDTRVLVTKSVIAGWGLNWQHCAHVVSFASHSYEQYYQSVRRCWRFGQTRPVVVDLIASEGEKGIRENLRRKQDAADRMFTELVAHMNDAIRVDSRNRYENPAEIPSWLEGVAS